MRVEQLDQLGEVGKRPRQPVDLVDDDHVDLPRPDIVHALLGFVLAATLRALVAQNPLSLLIKNVRATLEKKDSKNVFFDG